MTAGDPHDPFEVGGLRLLAAGHPTAVLDSVRTSGRRDLVADLLQADAQVRTRAIEVPAVQRLVHRVHDEVPLPAAGDAVGTRLRAWVHAILAERLLVDLEFPCLVAAREGLDEISALGPFVLPPLALRYARARLTRIGAAGWLMIPAADGLDEHVALRDQAVSDLLSCGFMEEVHATRGLMAGMVSTFRCEDIVENHDRLLDARKALGDDHDSMWSTMLDYFLGISCFEMGDLTGSLRAYERVVRGRFHHRRIDMMPAYGRAFFRIVTAGVSPTTIAGVEEALDDVRRHDPQVAQYWYIHLAHTLADMGSREVVRFVRLEAEMPAYAVGGQPERRLLELRAAAISGERVSVDAALDECEALVRIGNTRRAARAAVRLAHNLAMAGDINGAHTIQRWGIEHLPPRHRRTVWEEWWCRPVDSESAAVRLGTRPQRLGTGSATAATDRGLEVRVLSPTIEVEVDGRPVALSDAQAKLVLALVLAHPAPLHVERASDVLWPDVALNVTRARLSSLVHRLRRVLGDHGEAVVRSGDLLVLDDARCKVDLWWFQQALAGDPDERREALLSVRGNLGDAQFPYDEGFVEPRHRLSGEWVRHAGRAHRGGEVALAELEPALTSLNLTTTDLDV